MTRILSTGKQFVLTIPKELVELMKWKKGTEVIVSKYPEKRILYIEEVRKDE
ncbi:hypothetical protein JXA85_02000 [Candidatus Woesearchaeota archaeon]|nr:hypothetical protein [Candidatus Woesearchaeota archaeon]